MDPSYVSGPTRTDGSAIICPYQDPDVPGGLSLILTMHIFNILASLCGVLVNMFIAWALWSRRRFHTSRSVWFVLNLVLGALLGGSLTLGSLVMDTICPVAELVSHSETLCVLKMLAILLQWMININMHALIAMDRYLLIVHSLRYGDLMTKRRALAMIVSAWVFSLVASVSVLADNEWRPGVRCVTHDLIRSWHVMAVQLPVNVVVLAIVLAVHLRIRAEARRSVARHQRGWGQGQTRHFGLTLSTRSARALTLVVSCYVLAFMPSQVVTVLRACGLLSGDVLYVCMMVTWPLCVLSLLVNPLLYTWKNLRLRRDLKCTWALAMERMKRLLQMDSSGETYPVRQCRKRF